MHGKGHTSVCPFALVISAIASSWRPYSTFPLERGSEG